MPVKRSVWTQLATAADPTFPKYPCPLCENGHLKLQPGTYLCQETANSKYASKNDPDWEPDWTEERFVAFLECDDKGCGELVVVAGTTRLVPADPDEEYGGFTLESVLRPKSMVPPPPLFPIPKTAPYSVRHELQLAFQLYWADTGACISRLRTSLEALLDDKGIAHVAVGKNGKAVRLPLAARIDLFEKQYGDAENAESMHALRTIGNLGTHGDQVSREVLFDAMDVYEDALLEIYEGKTAKLKAKKLALKAMK